MKVTFIWFTFCFLFFGWKRRWMDDANCWVWILWRNVREKVLSLSSHRGINTEKVKYEFSINKYHIGGVQRRCRVESHHHHIKCVIIGFQYKILWKARKKNTNRTEQNIFELSARNEAIVQNLIHVFSSICLRTRKHFANSEQKFVSKWLSHWRQQQQNLEIKW